MVKKYTHILFFLLTAVTVLLFYQHTLHYPWKFFDEQIIYNETILPVPHTFGEIFDYLRFFGVNNLFEASNPFYSTISHIRGTPIDVIFNFFIFRLFQKNVFLYHLFSLAIHIFNTSLFFLILNKLSLRHPFKSTNTKLSLVSLFTLLWALHPANVESVLFASNYGAIVTYFFCFLFLNFYLKKKDNIFSNYFSCFLIFITYLFPLLLNEYSITLPAIIFCYLFATEMFENKGRLTSAFKKSTLQIMPLLFALALFVIYFFSLPTIRTTEEKSFLLTIERIFWLSPQIFIHYLKLIFHPLHLSIDQTDLVFISDSLISPYSLGCIAITFSLVILAIISLFNLKKIWGYFLFILLSVFFLSLFPFLHLISPTYSLANERYLYFPLAMIIFGFANIFFYTVSKISLTNSRIILAALTIVLVTLSIRSYTRTLDWQDSIALFSSAYKESKSDLLKALRLEFIGSILNDYSQDKNAKAKSIEYINRAITMLENLLQKNEPTNTPQILKLYGLDSETKKAKAAYFLAFTKIGLFRDLQGAYQTIKPFMEKLSLIDTPILDLYLGILFATDNFEDAEKLLNYAASKKLCPTILIAQSQLAIRKYNDKTRAEDYLKQSFKYFPYDIQTLSYLKSFYYQQNNAERFAYFSYLYGLRQHSHESLQDAYKVFLKLNNKEMTDKILKNIKSL